jgi:hypothetical protein
MSPELAGIKEFVIIAVALSTLISVGATLIGTWALLKYRLGVMERILFGNGKPGLIREFENLLRDCATRHAVIDTDRRRNGAERLAEIEERRTADMQWREQHGD